MKGDNKIGQIDICQKLCIVKCSRNKSALPKGVLVSKHVCPKCHKAKKVSVYHRHVRRCIPCARDLHFLSVTKSGSFNKEKAAAAK